MDFDSPDNLPKTAQLRRLSIVLANLPVVETLRVEATSRAIRNGSFEIDTDRVAENLLAFERLRLKWR